MYEIMLDKKNRQELEDIRQYIGEGSWGFLQEFEEELKERYDINRELRFPFGKSYGWGYKYAHRAKHLCYVFFERDAITVMLQIGDKGVPLLNEILPTLSETARSLWAQRYPCGENGGWIRFRILTAEDLKDCIRLVEIKQKPPHK